VDPSIDARFNRWRGRSWRRGGSNDAPCTSARAFAARAERCCYRLTVGIVRPPVGAVGERRHQNAGPSAGPRPGPALTPRWAVSTYPGCSAIRYPGPPSVAAPRPNSSRAPRCSRDAEEERPHTAAPADRVQLDADLRHARQRSRNHPSRKQRCRNQFPGPHKNPPTSVCRIR
jgi:hypothetical protein